jgi:hypothetical protein
VYEGLVSFGSAFGSLDKDAECSFAREDTVEKRFVSLRTLSPEIVCALSALIQSEMDYSRRLMLSTVDFCLLRTCLSLPADAQC